MKKRMLFVFTVLLMLLPINYLSAGITDTEGKTTNSKTTVVDHYNDKIENINIDLSNGKVYEFTESDKEGKSLLTNLGLKTALSGVKYYSDDAKEVNEKEALFKLESKDGKYSLTSINDEEVLTVSKKIKLQTVKEKYDSKTSFTGVNISGDLGGFINVGDPDDLMGGVATYNYRQDDYYNRTTYYLNLTYGYDTIMYKILEGDKQSYEEGKDIVIKASGSLEKVVSVKVNDEDLSEEDYSLEEGSTILTLKSSYLNSLENGEYKLTITYKDGEANGTFSIDSNIQDIVKESNNLVIYIFLGSVLVLVLIIVSLIIIKKKK